MTQNEYYDWINSLSGSDDDSGEADGRLDEEELFYGAAMTVIYGSPHAADAYAKIKGAYPSQLNDEYQGELSGLVNFVESNPPLKAIRENYEESQPTLLHLNSSARIHDESRWHEFDPAGTAVHDAWGYIKDIPHGAVELFDTYAEDDWAELTANDILSGTAEHTLALFPAFNSLQITPVTGGALTGSGGTDILIGRGNASLTGSIGVDAFMVGWVGKITINDFEATDKLILPSDYFGYDLNEVVGNISSVITNENGTVIDFFGGAVSLNLVGVHSITPEQVMLL